MILDERNEFASKFTVPTGVAADVVVGDVVDMGAASRDIGDGEPLFFVAQAATAIVVAATGSAKWELASSAAAAMTTPTKHVASATYPAGTIAAGTTILAVSLPRGALYLRYLGVLQTTVTAGVTSGTINLFLTKNPAKYRAYADAI